MNFLAIKNAVAGWADRTDLATPLALALPMAEERIFNGTATVPGLRLLSMLSNVPAFVSGAVPAARFLGVERMTVTVGGYLKTLQFLPPDQFAPYEGQAGEPAYYTVRGTSVIAAPLNGSTFSLWIYTRPATPAADGDENAVMLSSPRVYVYGLLLEIANWLRDAEMAALAETAFRDAMESARLVDERTKQGTGPVTIRTDIGVRV